MNRGPPVQDPVSAGPPIDQTNEEDHAVTDILVSPMHVISFSGVEWTAPGRQPVDGPVTTPTISPATSALYRQEPTPSRLLTPAGTGISQGLGRSRLSRRTATLLLVMALHFLRSADGLYATVVSLLPGRRRQPNCCRCLHQFCSDQRHHV